MPRRKPFSNKQKKAQLQEKRQKKKTKEGIDMMCCSSWYLLALPGDATVVEPVGCGDPAHTGSESEEEEQESVEVARLNLQPATKATAAHASGYDANRCKLEVFIISYDCITV